MHVVESDESGSESEYTDSTEDGEIDIDDINSDAGKSRQESESKSLSGCKRKRSLQNISFNSDDNRSKLPRH